MPVFIFMTAFYDPGFIFEIFTCFYVIIIPVGPFLFFLRTFEQAFGNDISVSCIQNMEQVHVITDPTVSNQDKTGEVQAIDILFQSWT